MWSGLTNNPNFIIRDSKTYIQKVKIPEFEHFLKLGNLEEFVKNYSSFMAPESRFLSKTNPIFFESLFVNNVYTLEDVSDKHKRLIVITKIGELLTKLHSLPLINITSYNYEFELMSMFKLLKNDQRIKHQCLLDDVMEKWSSFFPIFEAKGNLVVSHNDLVNGNIIFKEEFNEVYLIDFDGCSLNSPLFDIVSFCFENSLSNLEIKHFIKKFKKIIKPTEFRAMYSYQNTLWFFWAIYCFNTTNNKIYKDIANHKLSLLKRDATLYLS